MLRELHSNTDTWHWKCTKGKMHKKCNKWNIFSLNSYSFFCPFQLQPLILVTRCISRHSLFRLHTPENTCVTACLLLLFRSFFFFPKHFFHCNWLHMREKFAFMFHKNVLLIHNCTCHLIQIWAVALLITRTQ